MRQVAEQTTFHYYRFLYEQLFDRIGMYSAIMEPDASGTYVGSSYTYATPRDWARFGLLYLQEGIWHGERILPEGVGGIHSHADTGGAQRGVWRHVLAQRRGG